MHVSVLWDWGEQYFRSNMIKVKVVAASSSLRMEQAGFRNRDRDTN